MRRIKFYLGTGFSGASHSEVFEYEDNVTDEEINEDYEDWKKIGLTANGGTLRRANIEEGENHT